MTRAHARTLASGVPARAHPTALVLTATVVAQGTIVVAVPLYATTGPAGIGALRLQFAALVMLLIWRPRRADWNRRTLLAAASFGVAVAALVLGTTQALDRMPVATVVPIQMLGPLGVAVVTRRGGRDLLWVALAAGGVVALVGPDGTGVTSAGVAYALLSALGWAGYIVSAARLGRYLPSGGSGIAVSIAIAALLLTIPGWAEGGTALLRPEVLAAALALSLLGNVLVFRLETEALRRMSTTAFGVTMAAEPVIAAAWGMVLLGQGLDLAQAIGIACIAVAAAGATTAGVRRTDPPAVPAPPD